MTPLTKKIQAAVLALAILAPAESAFAVTKHHKKTYSTTTHHKKHYSQAGGALVGAAAGALIDRHQPLKGAAIGAAAGLGVQSLRNHNVKH